MAAGDIALRMLLTASDFASTVVVGMADTYDTAILSMTDSTVVLDDALNSLVPAIVDADGNIVALGVAVSDSASVMAKYGVTLDSAGASSDAFASQTANIDATLSSVDISATGAAASLDSLAISAAATDTALASVDVSAAAADTAIASEAVSADTAALSMANLSAAQDLVSASAEKLKMLGGIFTLLAAAVGITDIVSVKMAADFQQAMLSNVAHAGLAKSEFDKVSQSVLQISSVVGRSPTQLAEALYPILSAFSGIQNQAAKSSIALATLKMSFQTVAGTTVDGTAVANAAVGTFNALGLATNNVSTNTQRMTGLFDIMDKTVQLGNMQWDAYKNVVSKLAVAIQGTGITFKESQAALATMTNEGFSAQRASTYLSNTFTTLAIKTDALAKHAKSLGISFDEAKYGPMTLAQKIEYLNQITDGNKQKLLALMGNNSTALKTFNALSVGIDAYKSNLNSLNHAQGTLAGSFATASQGFNFQIQQMKAAGESFMVTLGTHLLPIFSKIVSNITPIINNLTNWENKTHGIENAMNMLVSVIGNVISVGGNIISFFQHNQAALVALGVALTIAAGAIGGLLVAAFIAWAVAAWSAAIATLAATWPILLIGAIVALVVVGIILAIQHWGQIVAWLKGVWAGIAGWFGGVFSALGATVHNGLNAIGNFFHSVWTNIQNFLRAAWNVIVNIVKVGAALLLGVILGPFLAIGALFVWLYNHNTYFKELIDAIVNIVKVGVAWLQNTWTAVTTWISDQWKRLTTLASVYWALLQFTIQQKIEQVKAILYSVMLAIGNFVIDKWNALVANTTALWSKISSIFSSAWNTYIAQPLSSLWNSIWSTVTSWGGKLLDAGKNLITMLANGIASGAGAIWNAVSGIAKNIWSALGFHSPTEKGPGADADTWMPNLISMLSSGLIAGVPKMQNAVNQVASPLTALSGGNSFGVRAGAGNAFALGGNGQTIIVQMQPGKQDIYLDKRKVGEGVMQYASKQIHIQGGHKNS